MSCEHAAWESVVCCSVLLKCHSCWTASPETGVVDAAGGKNRGLDRAVEGDDGGSFGAHQPPPPGQHLSFEGCS